MKNKYWQFASIVLAGTAIVALAQVPASFIRSGMLLSGQAQSGGVGPGASAYNHAGQTLTGGFATTILTFDTNSFDTGSIHSTSVNPTRFTAPSTGYYMATCNMQTSAAPAQMNLQIKVNGSVPTPSFTAAPGIHLDAAAGVYISGVLFLNSGDYVEFTTVIESGTSTVVDGSVGQLIKLSTSL